MLGGGVLSRRASVPYANASMPARTAAGMVRRHCCRGAAARDGRDDPYTATNLATSASHAAGDEV